jgi:7-cyano-7-deazaguanine synthase
MSGNKTALLFSGGLDSYIAHKWLENMSIEHDLVYIPCGTETSSYEMTTLRIMENESRIQPVHYIQPDIDLSTLQKPDGFVPLRNLMFLMLPVMEDYETVYIGAVRGEGTLDKSHKFFKDTSDLFSYMLSKRIRVASPIDQFTKTQLVKKALDMGVDEAELKFTTSCYAPSENYSNVFIDKCGECNACVRRWAAMVNNGIYEAYDVDPVFKAKELISATPVTAIFQQPLGRWPDVILTNKELRDAVLKIGL